MAGRATRGDGDGRAEPDSGLVPIEMEGDGPLVLREKVHAASPMTIDQALLEMELVGHDFYLFHDRECDRFSVVYRRRGYDYGVIRLVEEWFQPSGDGFPGRDAAMQAGHVRLVPGLHRGPRSARVE